MAKGLEQTSILMYIHSRIGSRFQFFQGTPSKVVFGATATYRGERDLWIVESPRKNLKEPKMQNFVFDDFQCDNAKRKANLEKHGIDFADAARIFQEPFLVRPSPRSEEERFVAIGNVDGHVIAVIFTVRGHTCRLISARRARKNEKDIYHKRIRR